MAVTRARRAGSAMAAAASPVGRGLASSFVVDWEISNGIKAVDGIDRDPSRVIRAFSKGKARDWFYQKMLLEDLDLAAQYRRRSIAVLALPRYWESGREGRKAGKAVDLCRAIFGEQSQPGSGRIPRFVNVENTLLNSLATGIEVAELLWSRIESGTFAGMWAPYDAVTVPISRFCMVRRELHALGKIGAKPVPAPPGKFLVCKLGDCWDSGWPQASLDYIYTSYAQSKELRGFEAVALEKFGAPTVVVYYQSVADPVGDRPAEAVNEELQLRAQELAEAVQMDFAAAIPDGFKVEVLSSLGSQNFAYGDALNQLKRGYARFISGEINTSGLRPGTGAFASDQVAADLLEQNLYIDSTVLEAAMTDVAKVIAEVNFGDPELGPRYLVDETAASDRQRRQAAIEKALDRGVPVVASEFRQVFQLRTPRPGEETIGGNPPLNPPEVPAPDAPQEEAQ